MTYHHNHYGHIYQRIEDDKYRNISHPNIITYNKLPQIHNTIYAIVIHQYKHLKLNFHYIPDSLSMRTHKYYIILTHQYIKIKTHEATAWAHKDLPPIILDYTSYQDLDHYILPNNIEKD